MHTIFDTAAWKLLLSCWKTDSTDQSFSLEQYNEHGSVDESFLLDLIDRHRVAPLAYLNLSKLDIFSDDFKNALKSRVLACQVDALKSKQFMLKLHGFISSKGYDFLFLKGIGIAEKYYGDPGLRSSIDVDLWVEPQGVNAVTGWLRQLGYIDNAERMGLNDRQSKYLYVMEHGMGFSTERLDLPRMIELHTHINSSYSDFSYNPICEKKRQITLFLGEIQFPMMGHEDQFLYLCVHGTEHAWFRLKWLFDLPWLMQKVEFDWAHLRDRALIMRCLPHLEISMLVLQSLLGIPIPKSIVTNLNADKYKSQLRHIYASIASQKGINEADLSRWRHLLYSLNFVQGFPRTSFFLHYLTGPGDWQLIRLPKNLFFLYYILRPILWLYRRIVVAPTFVKNKSDQ